MLFRLLWDIAFQFVFLYILIAIITGAKPRRFVRNSAVFRSRSESRPVNHVFSWANPRVFLSVLLVSQFVLFYEFHRIFSSQVENYRLEPPGKCRNRHRRVPTPKPCAGIVIDAFSGLRDEKEAAEQDLQTKCFVCHLDRFTLDQKGPCALFVAGV